MFYTREITKSDQEFLFEMLYRSIYVKSGEAPPEKEIVRKPELSRYVENWGGEGDRGLVAVDRESALPIGVVWTRLFSADNRGYGYIDDDTPELGIAVALEWRGQGVGTALLRELFSLLEGSSKAVSLSVDVDNPVVRLYKREGFQVWEQKGSSLIMRKPIGMPPKEVVLNYWKAMETNDFAQAAAWLSEDYECLWPQTSELIKGKDNFIAVNEQYPAEGQWTFRVNSVVSESDRVVTDVTISDGSMVARAITFHTVKEGMITRQTEYWPESYEPPVWRKQWVTIVKE